MKLPHNQKVYVTYHLSIGEYVVTADPRIRDKYTLYKKLSQTDYEKILSDQSALKLEKHLLKKNNAFIT